MIEIDGDGLENSFGETVLAALCEAQVFIVDKTNDGRFRFTERCDDYYSAILTRDQMLLLAAEIAEMANGMVGTTGIEPVTSTV